MKKIFFIFTTILILGLAACSQDDNDYPDPTVTDVGIMIGDTRWATRNVGAPGTFASSPTDVGMLFQWNRRQGWAATGNVTDWDSSIPTGTRWYEVNDPCPEGWRVPTQTELVSLYNTSSRWTTQSGVRGRIFGIEQNFIFLPAVGWRVSGFVDIADDGTLLGAGSAGHYWSSVPYSGDNALIRSLNFGSHSVNVGVSCRAEGLPIRCVAR